MTETGLLIELHKHGRLDANAISIACASMVWHVGLDQFIVDLGCEDVEVGVNGGPEMLRDVVLRALGCEPCSCPIPDGVDFDDFTPEQLAAFEAWNESEQQRCRDALIAGVQALSSSPTDLTPPIASASSLSAESAGREVSPHCAGRPQVGRLPPTGLTHDERNALLDALRAATRLSAVRSDQQALVTGLSKLLQAAGVKLDCPDPACEREEGHDGPHMSRSWDSWNCMEHVEEWDGEEAP